MKRFWILFVNEFKLTRTAVPSHIVAIIQPTILYLFMGAILGSPFMAMNLRQPDTPIGEALQVALQEEGSPIGDRYVNLNLVEQSQPGNLRQVIVVEEENGTATAVQRYGLIDANHVKNLRNRLTSAALSLWSAELGDQAVTIQEHPWLPKDNPHKFYFGMGLLPMAMFLATIMLGSVLTSQDFEFGTIQEERLAPSNIALPVLTRITRVTLYAYLSVILLLLVSGSMTGFWPASVWPVFAALLPVGIIGGGFGIVLGLIFRSSVTVYVLSMALSMALWLFGNSFGLTNFGGLYAFFTQLSPNSYAVELIFPQFFGRKISLPHMPPELALTIGVVGMISAALLTYRWRVRKNN
jgi:hypothetical protein